MREPVRRGEQVLVDAHMAPTGPAEAVDPLDVDTELPVVLPVLPALVLDDETLLAPEQVAVRDDRDPVLRRAVDLGLGDAAAYQRERIARPVPSVVTCSRTSAERPRGRAPAARSGSRCPMSSAAVRRLKQSDSRNTVCSAAARSTGAAGAVTALTPWNGLGSRRNRPRLTPSPSAAATLARDPR